MSRNFLDNLYGTLFTPDKTFSELKEEIPLVQATITVIAVSMLNVLLSTDYSFAGASFFQGLNLFAAALGGLISWFFFASFFELNAKIFGKGGNYKKILVLSAFALLPWIFLAPVQIFKLADISQTGAGNFFGVLIWLWVIGLEILAVLKTYELSAGKTLLFVIMPFLGWLVFTNWFVSFFTTIASIFSA